MINKDTYNRLTDKEHGYKKCASCSYRNSQYCQYCDDICEIEKQARTYLIDLEDKIENGTLIELPCTIGSTIYLVPSETQFRLNNIDDFFKKYNRIYEMEVYQIYINKNDYVLYNFEKTESALGSSFGETWFLTEAEAEARLKELEEKSNVE